MRKIFFLGAMMLFAPSLFAQFIKVKETDQSNNTHSLEKRRQAVDINSKLDLEIDQAAIFDAANEGLTAKGDPRIDSLITTLKQYRKLIETMEANIALYEKAFQSVTPDLALQEKTTAQRAQAALDILAFFPEDSRLGKRFETALEESTGDGDVEDFQILSRLLLDELQYIEKDVTKLRKKAGFYFQLAAWMATDAGQAPVKIEGFDDLPQGEFYEFERNRLYLTPDQLKELEGLNNFFEGMDKSNTFEKLSGAVLGILSQAIDVEGIKLQIQTVLDRVKNLETTAKAQKDAVIARMENILAKWTGLGQKLEGLKAKYTNRSGVETATSKLDVLYGFYADAKGLGDNIQEIYDLSEQVVTLDDFKKIEDAGNSLANGIGKLTTDLKTAKDNLMEYSKNTYQMALYGRQINTGALEISKKVRKLALDKIPSTTTIDLRFTGKRKPGDVLVMKALLFKGDDKDPIKTEVREFVVMNALPHVHMTVAYTFAKPVQVGENFKGGPLVSVLYKFRSRSLAYRNFFDPGIGLHAASFDFTNDDTPEFAAGIVTSMFRDYLQFGWGFNFNANAGYWFAGLRIPLPNSPVSLFGQ